MKYKTARDFASCCKAIAKLEKEEEEEEEEGGGGCSAYLPRISHASRVFLREGDARLISCPEFRTSGNLHP